MSKSEKSEKIIELNTLSTMLFDAFNDFSTGCRIGDPHHILWAGNPDAKYMYVQMCPDNAELFWAKRYEKNEGFVGSGPIGQEFRRKAKEVGFNPDKDFFYVNIVPYYPLGGGVYPNEIAQKFLWVLDGLLGIVEPDVVIPMGFQVFKLVTGTDNLYLFEGAVKDRSLIRYDNMIIAPAMPATYNEENKAVKSNYSILNVLFTTNTGALINEQRTRKDAGSKTEDIE